MRLSSAIIVTATFVFAAIAALLTADFSVTLIEENTEIEVRDAFDDNGLTWAEVQADGLQVTIAGMAPSEALRFQALTTAGAIVDASRIIDEMGVQSVAAIAAPRFSVEVLRNDAGISIIGLVPASTDRDAMIKRIGRIGGSDYSVADLLETADFPAPAGWEDAVSFGIRALEELPRSKVSIDAGQVVITAIADSVKAKTTMETDLGKAAPSGLRVSLNITAPRPVITPFTLRFVRDAQGARFDACSADTVATQDRIVAAASKAGLQGQARCTLGMGVPTPQWGEAAALAIAALAEIGQGSVTFSNADISLIAAEGTDQSVFDKVVGELETSLPEVFALYSKLTETVDPDQGPPEFVATLSPEGQVQLRGRLPSENMRNVADSFAKARFGSDNVYTAARVVGDLPADWPRRVLTGLEALGTLANGAVIVLPDRITVTGNTGNPDAAAELARMLAEKLGEEEAFDIAVDYKEQLDPVLGLPTPEECETQIAEIVAQSKISFEPGSATIDASALGTMDRLAELLQTCGDIALEIQGYTDSQGREEMNQSLSQSRAQSVLNELRARRVLTASYVAQGYGEDNPIADNDSEEGREANRRIEFKLIAPTPSSIKEGDSALESIAETSDTDQTSVTDETEGETVNED